MTEGGIEGGSLADRRSGRRKSADGKTGGEREHAIQYSRGDLQLCCRTQGAHGLQEDTFLNCYKIHTTEIKATLHYPQIKNAVCSEVMLQLLHIHVLESSYLFRDWKTLISDVYGGHELHWLILLC